LKEKVLELHNIIRFKRQLRWSFWRPIASIRSSHVKTFKKAWKPR